MRIITTNVNGVRAAAKKGYFTWLAQQKADVVCLQETKAQVDQLTNPLFHPSGYHCFYHDAEKKGYSGVAIYARDEPEEVIYGIGWKEIDKEGRYLEVRFSNVNVVSLYMHSGSSGFERQKLKFDFMKKFLPYLRKLQQGVKPYIICGDWNIVHQRIDIKNWNSNKKRSGCLPEERAWMEQLFNEVGLVDAFRVVNQEAGQYTWWSNRGKARELDRGWRIDYLLGNAAAAKRIQSSHINREGGLSISDHAPVIVDLK